MACRLSSSARLKWHLSYLNRVPTDAKRPADTDLVEDFGESRMTYRFDATNPAHLAYYQHLVQKGLVI